MVNHQWSLELRACQAGLFQSRVTVPRSAWPQQRATYRLSSGTRSQLDPEGGRQWALVSLTQSLGPTLLFVSFSLGQNHPTVLVLIPAIKELLILKNSPRTWIQPLMEWAWVMLVRFLNQPPLPRACNRLIHSSNTYLLSIYFVSKAFLGVEDRVWPKQTPK